MLNTAPLPHPFLYIFVLPHKFVDDPQRGKSRGITRPDIGEQDYIIEFPGENTFIGNTSL